MPSRKTKTHTLNRVRDNQRRCRARKREYVAELEQKLQKCQLSGIQPDVKTHQNIVNRLNDENERLRELLDQAGVSQSSIETHLGGIHAARESSGSSNGPNKQVSSYLQESFLDDEMPRITPLVPDDQGTPPSPSFNELLNAPFLELPEDFSLFELMPVPLTDLPSTLPTVESGSLTAPAPVPCPSLLPEISDSAWSLPPLSFIPGDLGSSKTGQKGCDTTLCIVAYEMICQHNKKGVDMMEIGIRLWNGFIKGDRDDEGCKVENRVLFSVLDYIRA